MMRWRETYEGAQISLAGLIPRAKAFKAKELSWVLSKFHIFQADSWCALKFCSAEWPWRVDPLIHIDSLQKNDTARLRADRELAKAALEQSLSLNERNTKKNP